MIFTPIKTYLKRREGQVCRLILIAIAVGYLSTLLANLVITVATKMVEAL